MIAMSRTPTRDLHAPERWRFVTDSLGVERIVVTREDDSLVRLTRGYVPIDDDEDLEVEIEFCVGDDDILDEWSGA